MLDSWIESVFLKRMALAAIAGVVSHFAAFLASPLAAPAFQHLSAIGITVTVVVDQVKLGHFLTVGLFALSQAGHEWLAAKYPDLGKYL